MTELIKDKDRIQPRRRVAAYLRSATSYAPDDAQDPAIREQAELIRVYAEKNNMDVVKTYIDTGKRDPNGRPGLRCMVADVHSGAAEYEVILMRDISRWGREQPDESAHYEFVCRRAGFEVHYADQPVKNIDALMSNMPLIMKRALAREYLRERAAKAND
jgi:DNA invertase Pin-like site-specific DNA recombinase